MRLTRPSPTGKRHPVADADRPFGQQDQAGNEIVDDRLQAEADADAERAGDDGEVGEVEARRGEREARGDDVAGIGCALADRILHALVDARFRRGCGGRASGSAAW